MASNVASTTEQVRQDFQYSSSVDGLLKQVYIPALNNTTFHATPLMEMFGDFGGVIDFAANKIIKGFKHQGAGGFGGISEGGDFVKGRKQKGFQGAERLKWLNAYLSLTGPAARTVKAGAGAFVNAVSDGMDDTLKLSRMQMERMIGGSGTGELCRVAMSADIAETAAATGEYIDVGATATSSTYASTHVHTAVTGTSNTTSGGYNALQFMQPGIRVNAIQDGNLSSGTPFVLDNNSEVAVFEVGHVDYAASTFSLKFLPITSTSTLNMETYDDDTWVLVLEGAYGEIETAGGTTSNSCLELNGLYNLVDDGTTHGIWGLTRSTYPHALKSSQEAAGSAELDEELLIGYILDLVNIKNSTPNVLVTDPKSRLKYFSNRKEDRRFDMKVMDSMFGFRSIGVVIDQYSLLLQSLSSLIPGTLFMLNTNAFKFAKATNGFQWIEDGGQIMRNFETKDGVFAAAINYCEFVCEDPKGQLKVTGLSY